MESSGGKPENYMSKPVDKKKKNRLRDSRHLAHMANLGRSEKQKGGGDETSWWTILLYIIHVILSVFAVYTAYSCGSGVLSYLAACCFPYIYLPYVIFTDNSMCGVRGKMAQVVARPVVAVQKGGWRR